MDPGTNQPTPWPISDVRRIVPPINPRHPGEAAWVMLSPGHLEERERQALLQQILSN
jgi:hypothetical protein